LVRRVFERVDELLSAQDINHKKLNIYGGGLSSGEGLINAIRDPSDDPKSNDMGVTDKRLLVVEPEFANVLAQCKRESSILSPIIRNLYDGKTLAPLTKANRIQATNPHVVIIGHITQHELNQKSGPLEAANGFLNRFLICAIERDQLVPLPKKTSDAMIDKLAQELINTLRFIDQEATKTNGCFEIDFTPEAEACWVQIYPTLTQERLDHIGSLMARMEVYARMLTMIFCLLDKKTEMEVKHLKAALLWIDYIVASIEYIFGQGPAQQKQTEIQELADRIESLFSKTGSMTKTAINNALGGHVKSERIDEALAKLLNTSPPILNSRTEETKGKSKQIFELRTAN